MYYRRQRISSVRSIVLFENDFYSTRIPACTWRLLESQNISHSIHRNCHHRINLTTTYQLIIDLPTSVLVNPLLMSTLPTFPSVPAYNVNPPAYDATYHSQQQNVHVPAAQLYEPPIKPTVTNELIFD
jgi:hypothetical protein